MQVVPLRTTNPSDIFCFFQPFVGNDEDMIYKRIGAGTYKWPKGLRVGASLKSIVAGLLNTNVEDRLGINTPVMDHPWLDNIDWDKMETGRYLVSPHPCDIGYDELTNYRTGSLGSWNACAYPDMVEQSTPLPALHPWAQDFDTPCSS